ncbi:hypothetical protein [Leptospira santarosai]|uniref:hypothetical protein n=1 Tax=Leptospira santarosai TaxID=28183 RepID=UPI0009D6E12F|nr:hypothetical protein [Leptospira santarosai]ASV12856.1 hypothetical protein B2G51_15865 [Leptospira santarosai]MDO6381233.1 hypothetical protein [Leptospira santarosai]
MRKIFHYDHFDKFLTHESWLNTPADNDEIERPGDSTYVAPPYNYSENLIPVFIEEKNYWTLAENNFWNPEIIDLSYNSGEILKGIPQLPTILADRLHIFPSIPKLLAIGLFGFRFECRVQELNRRIKDIYIIHDELYKKSGIAIPQFSTYYTTEIELIVYLMKKVIDELITLTYVQTFYEKILNTHLITIDSIGSLFKENDDEIILLREKLNFNIHKNYFKIINDLHNSMKHDITFSEAFSFRGVNEPCAFSLQSKKGNYHKITFHAHSINQLVSGLTKFLKEIFGPNI